jgi:hypothetical protein
MLVAEKLCRKCNQTKPLDGGFHKNRAAADGLQAYCKQCMNLGTSAYQKTEKGSVGLRRARKKQDDSGYHRFGKGGVATLRASAKNRNIAFDLTADSLETWWHATPDTCDYCGISIADYFAVRDAVLAYEGTDGEITKYRRFFRTRTQRGIRWMTIDRVNNSEGYTLSNMVKACWICNSLKSNFFTADDMKAICPGLMARLRARLEQENDHLNRPQSEPFVLLWEELKANFE